MIQIERVRAYDREQYINKQKETERKRKQEGDGEKQKEREQSMLHTWYFIL